MYKSVQLCTTIYNCVQNGFTQLYNCVQPCKTVYNRVTFTSIYNSEQRCTTVYNCVQPCTTVSKHVQLCTKAYNPINLLPLRTTVHNRLCHFSLTYCLRYQGDRVFFRLFCIFYRSVKLVHILNEIANLWVISRVSHFGKKFEFCSVNLGSHLNRYFRKVSSFSEFSSKIYYSPIDMQICYISIIFALREDLICHCSITNLIPFK